MKKCLHGFYIVAGWSNGLVFIWTGLNSFSPWLTWCGVALAALAAVTLLDALRATPIKFSALLPWRAASRTVHYHRQRISSLYRLYHMSHDLVQLQLETRSELQRLQYRISLTGFTESLKGQPSKPSGPELLSHSDSGFGSLTSAFERLKASDKLKGLNALVVTDIGMGDLGLPAIDQILEGEIEPDYWIAKKALFGYDLLVLPGEVMREEPKKTVALLAQLEGRYERVVCIAADDVVHSLRDSKTPTAKKILSANPQPFT